MAGRSKAFLFIAATLMILIGLAWGAGGAVLLAGGSTFPEIIASGLTLRAIAFGLLIVGATLIVAGTAALLRRRMAFPFGVAAAIAFAVDGFVSNLVLFHSLRPTHTLTDAALALVIWSFLVKGRPALR